MRYKVALKKTNYLRQLLFENFTLKKQSLSDEGFFSSKLTRTEKKS